IGGFAEMPDVQVLFTRYRSYFFYFLALFVLGWGFTSYKTVFAGLILGTCASFFNLWLLYRKTWQLTSAIKEGKTVYSLGSLSRLASAALVIMISIRFPEYFHIVSSIIGLAAAYIIILLDFLFNQIGKKDNWKRG